MSCCPSCRGSRLQDSQRTLTIYSGSTLFQACCMPHMAFGHPSRELQAICACAVSLRQSHVCMHSPPSSKPSVRAQYPFIQAVDIEVLDLGEQPPAIGGAKSYATSNDEAVLEAPVMWGGDARVRVAVRVKLGGFVLYLPVEVRDLQVTRASCPSSIPD